MRIFLIFLLFITYIYAKEIKPTFILKSKGFVNDFVIDKTKLYVANDEGSVEIFDILSKKLVGEIFIEPIYSKKQVWQNARILSVDRYGNKTLIVSSTMNGFRNVWLHDGKTLKHIIKLKDKMSIKEARFINDDQFIFGTLGYEMILYNTQDSYSKYKIQVEQSSFTDLSLSEDKSKMVTASESGQVTISDVKTGNVIKQFKPLNLDKVFQVSYKNGTVITAGQDRRVGVYPKVSKPYYIKSDFLVYSASLSPSANIGIYSSSANSDLQTFDIKTGKKIDKLIGHYAIPTTIKFFDEKGLFSAGYENKIFYWRLN